MEDVDAQEVRSTGRVRGKTGSNTDAGEITRVCGLMERNFPIYPLQKIVQMRESRVVELGCES